MNAEYIRTLWRTVLLLFLMTTMSYCTTDANKPSTHTVIVEATKFQPAILNVHPGDTILFANLDIVTHDATEVNKSWFSPPVKIGESWK